MVDKNELVEKMMELNGVKLPCVEERVQNKHTPLYSAHPEIYNIIVNSYYSWFRGDKPHKNYVEILQQLYGANAFEERSFNRVYDRVCTGIATQHVLPELRREFKFVDILGFCHNKHNYAYELDYRINEFANEFIGVYNSVDFDEDRVRELLDEFLSVSGIDLNKEHFEYVFTKAYGYISTKEMQRVMSQQNPDIMKYLQKKRDIRKALENKIAEQETDDETPNM